MVVTGVPFQKRSKPKYKRRDGNVPQKYSPTLDDGTMANVGSWVNNRKKERKRRLENGIQEKSPTEERLDEIGILWEVVTKRTIEVEEYIAEIVKYKETQEEKHPGKEWDGNVPQKYSPTLDDGTTAKVGTWVNHRKTERRRRLENGIQEKSLAEEQLDEIGILWEVVTKRTIEVEEYIAEIVKYKETQEEKHPGKEWDGKVPQKYSPTLDDGTTAKVGTWVSDRKKERKRRLENGIQEKSLAEEQLDEIGILWGEDFTKRTIEVEEYIAEIVKYKETQEEKHPGKEWDGNVPRSYSVTLDDGTTANVSWWVNDRKKDRKRRLENGIQEKSLAEEQLDEIGILWNAR
jgi:hypothetical protein